MNDNEQQITVAHLQETYVYPLYEWIYYQTILVPNVKSLVITPLAVNLEKYNHAETFGINELSSPRKQWELFSYFYLHRPWYFKQVINAKKVDIIHAQFGNVGRRALWLAKKTGAKLIVSFYGVDLAYFPNKNHTFYNELFQAVTYIIALSIDMKQVLIRLGCPEEKIKIVHVGIDCNKFSYKKRPLHKPFRFICLARFIMKKGVPYTVLAMAKVVKKYPNTQLHLVGDGPLLPTIKRYIKEYNLQNNVTIIDNINTRNPREIAVQELYNAHALILFSTQCIDDYSATPLVVIEAQASGIPVITSDDPAVAEAVNPKYSFIVQQKNVNQLAEKMLYIIENQQVVEKYGKAGRKHVLQNFNFSKIGEQLSEIYHEVALCR